MNARINPNEKGVVHDRIRVSQFPDHPAVDLLKSGMAEQIAAEKIAGLDLVGFKEAGQLIAGKASLWFDGNHKGKPGWIAVRGCVGKQQSILIWLKNLVNLSEVFFALFYK